MYNDDDFKDEEVEDSESSQTGGNKLLDFYEANKKLIWILGGIIIFVLIASLFMGGGGNSNVTPKEPNLVISSHSERVSIKNSTQLYAKVEGDSQALFTWISSNPDVATVNSNGVVTGVNYGTTIITVTYTKNGKPYSEKCEVVVAEGNPNVEIREVSFQNGEVMISTGDTFKLPVIVNPSDGYMKNITFTSYNTDVVSVDSNGVIKALKVGKGTIRVTVNNKLTDEINVHVLDKKITAQILVNPTSIEFLDNLLTIEVEEKVELEYNYEPFDASLTDLIWSSSNTNVATVVNGVVTGVNTGKAEITVSSLNGIKKTMIVEVVPKNVPVESVQILSDTHITLNIGGYSNIAATVTPSDATTKDLTYQSSNPSIVAVDNKGSVLAIAAGNAQITITSVDGGKKTTVNVVVNSSGGSTGGSSSGGSSSSSIGYIKFRDANDKSISDSVSSALSSNHTGPVTVSRSSGTVTKFKYCVQKCTNSDDCGSPTCTPSTELTLGGKINFTNGNGIYVIKSIKYNGNLSEEVKLKYVNIGGVTSLGGTTASNKACYMVGGERKWTTESEALKEDDDAYKLTSYKTQGECDGTGSTSTASLTVSSTGKYWASGKTGYSTQIKFSAPKEMKKICYCYGSCNMNVDAAKTPQTGTKSFSNGAYTYYLLSDTKTYCMNTSVKEANRYFYKDGTSRGTVKFVVVYSDGTMSSTKSVNLSSPS